MYIEPVFGSTQFAKLDPERLEKYYACLRKCKHRCDGRRSRNHVCVPLGASSVRQIHFVLTGAGQRGVRWKYLTINPVELAQPPAAKKTTPTPKPRRSCGSPQ